VKISENVSMSIVGIGERQRNLKDHMVLSSNSSSRTWCWWKFDDLVSNNFWGGNLQGDPT
jgi:hypothetical protein